MEDKYIGIYIGADPFTYNDLELIKKTIRINGFVKIFLDRRNLDAEHKEYFLNYSDRADIIKHDLFSCKIEDFQIIPIDSTLQESIHSESIDTLVLNFDYQRTIDFRMMNIIQEMSPDLTISLIKAPNFIEQRFIKTLIDSDASLKLYRKYCSDYSFCKFKLKHMKKIALTGNDDYSLDIVQKVLEQHGYKIVDVDKFIQNEYTGSKTSEKDVYNAVNSYVAKSIVGVFSNKIVIRGKKFFEFAMEKMFYKTICVKSKQLVEDDDLMDIEEKASYADFLIDANCSTESVVSNALLLANGALKKIK